LAEEDAAAVGPVVQLVAAFPGRPAPHERGVPAEVVDGVPALIFDALALLVGEVDAVFLAAAAGDVTVPALYDRQVQDGSHWRTTDRRADQGVSCIVPDPHDRTKPEG